MEVIIVTFFVCVFAVPVICATLISIFGKSDGANHSEDGTNNDQ